jgi:hypothetical protein
VIPCVRLRQPEALLGTSKSLLLRRGGDSVSVGAAGVAACLQLRVIAASPRTVALVDLARDEHSVAGPEMRIAARSGSIAGEVRMPAVLRKEGSARRASDAV